MIRLLRAPLAQGGSGGASSLFCCAQECECEPQLFMVFSIQRGLLAGVSVVQWNKPRIRNWIDEDGI